MKAYVCALSFVWIAATHANSPHEAKATASIVEEADCVQSLDYGQRAKIRALMQAFEAIAPLKGNGVEASPEYEAKAKALLAKQGGLSPKGVVGLIAMRQGSCASANRTLRQKGAIPALQGELALSSADLRLEQALTDPEVLRDPLSSREGHLAPQHLTYLRDMALSRMRESKFPRYDLSDTELAIIYGYSGGSLWRVINGALQQRAERPEYYAKVKPIIDTLSSALSKLPPYKGIVYGSYDLTTDLSAPLSDYETGAIVSELGFLSTALPNAPQKFHAPHELIIESQSCRMIWGYAMNPGEREVLCPAGMKFLVTKIEHMEKFHMKECPSGNASICGRP